MRARVFPLLGQAQGEVSEMLRGVSLCDIPSLGKRQASLHGRRFAYESQPTVSYFSNQYSPSTCGRFTFFAGSNLALTRRKPRIPLYLPVPPVYLVTPVNVLFLVPSGPIVVWLVPTFSKKILSPFSSRSTPNEVVGPFQSV